MSEKTAQAVEISPSVETSEESRFLPLAIAALICFAISVILGVGAWYLFGTSNGRNKTVPVAEQKVPEVSAPSEATPLPLITENTAPETNSASENSVQQPQPETVQPAPIEGVVSVKGGDFAIGGDKNRPLRRAIVSDFMIAETEVTNAQYAEFIKETNYEAPPDWKDNKFPDGTENYPVTKVSWRDANEFCRWMSKKLNAEVRLPTEVEWELAAGGRSGKKYPWGSKWNKEGGFSKETGGKISAVKSFALNRTAEGAFDMVGNVWEWTQDKVTSKKAVTDEKVKESLNEGQSLRVIKGGTASDPATQIFVQSRYEISESAKFPEVGFRYIVIRAQQNPA